MSYVLKFSQKTDDDIRFHKKSGNNAVIKKIIALLDELSESPFTGTGKPEQLKYNMSTKWSRRINREHRLVYEVIEDVVFIHSAKGHYE